MCNNVSNLQSMCSGVIYVQYAHNSVTEDQYMRSNIICMKVQSLCSDIICVEFMHSSI